MTKGTKTALYVIGAGVGLYIIYRLYKGKQVVVKAVNTKIQASIDRIMTSDDSGNWKQWRQQNLSGKTLETAKAMVFDQALQYSGYTGSAGSVDDYNYPNIESAIAQSASAHSGIWGEITGVLGDIMHSLPSMGTGSGSGGGTTGDSSGSGNSIDFAQLAMLLGA